VQYLNASETAADSFVVYSQDGTAQQTVTVTITGANYETPNLDLVVANLGQPNQLLTNDGSGNFTATGAVHAMEADQKLPSGLVRRLSEGSRRRRSFWLSQLA
jgi:hypothetical protein